MRNRRSFLGLLAGGVAGGLLSTAEAFGVSTRFAAGCGARIGAPVALRSGNGERISAVLEAVNELHSEAGSPWRTTAVQFRVEDGSDLVQDVYHVRVRGLDAQRLLLVPICSTDGRGRLEAILTHRRRLV